MYKALFSLSAVLCTVLTPILSSADDGNVKQTDKPVKADRKDSLQHTQQRLNALIKAAANQNLVDIQKDGQSNSAAPKKLQNIKSPQVQNVVKDCGVDVFSFPSEARINTYSDLQSLKNQVVNGRDEIDPHKTQMLAFAYLGLGFGDEALLMSTVLKGQEKAAIQAMANILMETANQDDHNYMRAQAPCNNGAQIWLDMLGEHEAPLTDIQIKKIRENLEALPSTLRNILGPRLGIKALQMGDMKSAKVLYKSLIKLAPKNADTHQVMMDADLRFFEAMLALKDVDVKGRDTKKGNIKQKATAIHTLKFFAKKDNPYQVQALQMLSVHTSNQSDLQKDGGVYPGYAQDLDAAAQTYSGHKMGKQALAQKVAYLAQSHALESAVNLTKDSFDAGDAYFKDSVIAISGFVHADLNSKSTNTQIWALEILMREADFFADMNDAGKLNRAGVTACAQLALPQLAAQIMPMDTWHNLDAKTQTLLALSLGDDLRKQEIASIFPKHILQQAEFKALEIEQAFANKNPGKAIKILSGTPKNDIVKNAFVTHSWTAGYWSLVDNNIRRKKQNGKIGAEGNAKSTLAPEAKNLAANLSANAPLLATSNKAYDIAELTSLQTYLKNDLAVFQTYLSLENTNTQIKNQNKDIGKSNG